MKLFPKKFKLNTNVSKATLNKIGLKYGTDKSSILHDYCTVYENYFKPWRENNVSLFEIGVGGYDKPDQGGSSLKMWYEYFQNSKIIGLDCYQKTGIENDRTTFRLGSQTDAELLTDIIKEQKKSDIRIVIDDGSHISEHQIETFKIIFPLLTKGDYYVCEDLQTSLWSEPAWYGGNEKPNEPGTALFYFQTLIPQLYSKTLLKKYQNNFISSIEYMHFYQNMVIIKKK